MVLRRVFDAALSLLNLSCAVPAKPLTAPKCYHPYSLTATPSGMRIPSLTIVNVLFLAQDHQVSNRPLRMFLADLHVARAPHLHKHERPEGREGSSHLRKGRRQEDGTIRSSERTSVLLLLNLFSIRTTMDPVLANLQICFYSDLPL